ncbi:MAG TPA: hypothetical protein VF545_11865 [Thermoleophilaceae bacterium]
MVLALLAGAAAGCGSDSADGGSNDRRQILSVMHTGRLALLRGDGRVACSLLTPHGRRRALDFQVDYLPEGTAVPSNRPGIPHTCEEMVKRQLRDEHQQGSGGSWTPDLERARFRVRSVDGSRAKAQLYVPVRYGPTVDLTLLRVNGRWRVDDSPVVPSGY